MEGRALEAAPGASPADTDFEMFTHTPHNAYVRTGKSARALSPLGRAHAHAVWCCCYVQVVVCHWRVTSHNRSIAYGMSRQMRGFKWTLTSTPTVMPRAHLIPTSS